MAPVVRATKQPVKQKDETAVKEAFINILNWIPANGLSLEGSNKKSKPQPIEVKLNLRHASTKIDNFQRTMSYFAVLNPEALSVVKEDVDANGLDIANVSLPFWKGEDDYMLRVLAAHCSLSEEQLKSEVILDHPVQFQMYTGKKQHGYSVAL